ncbi:PEP-CTERM sorting domain-containing protein [Pseudoduganella sp. HUAS MS19]
MQIRLSDFYSPYDNEYLARIGRQADPDFQWLRVTLMVERDGGYSGRFTFGQIGDEYTGDAAGSYHRGFVTNYQFHFSGAGMALETVMDSALAEKLWRNEKISYTRFSTQWMYDRVDSQTGEEIPIAGEGWDGKMEMVEVPEPTTLALFGIGFAGFASLRRKKSA